MSNTTTFSEIDYATLAFAEYWSKRYYSEHEKLAAIQRATVSVAQGPAKIKTANDTRTEARP